MREEYFEIQNRAAFKEKEARFVDPFQKRKYSIVSALRILHAFVAKPANSRDGKGNLI